MLRRGECSPQQLIAACEARITAVDGQVNATPIRCFDRARRRARALRVPDSAAPPGYLWGLPVLIKDALPVSGLPFVVGSPLFRNRVAQSTDAAVERLERNGAIVIGKTNVPEASLGSNTFNPVFGTTRNPWSLNLTVGGSSGGSAAALATGQAWLAVGTDYGGSLRIPGAFCGIVGFRVSPATIPRDPVASDSEDAQADSLHVISGPMARSVADVALLLDAMWGTDGWAAGAGGRGAHPRFYKTLQSAAAAEATGSTRWRVAWSPDLGGVFHGAVDPRVSRACFAAVVGTFGRDACRRACPDMTEAPTIFKALRAARVARIVWTSLGRVSSAVSAAVASASAIVLLLAIRRLFRQVGLEGLAFSLSKWRVTAAACAFSMWKLIRPVSLRLVLPFIVRLLGFLRYLNPEIVWNTLVGLPLLASPSREATAATGWGGLTSTAMTLSRARERCRALQRRVSEFLTRYDVLCMPCVMVQPFPHKIRYPSQIGTRKLESYVEWLGLTSAISLTNCPAISVPCGRTPDGLPIGLQIIARRGADIEVLIAAHKVETWARAQVDGEVKAGTGSTRAARAMVTPPIDPQSVGEGKGVNNGQGFTMSGPRSVGEAWDHHGI